MENDDDKVEACISRAFELLNPDTEAAHALATQAIDLAPPGSSAAGRAHHALGMANCLLGRADPGSGELRMAAEILDLVGPPTFACRAWRDCGSVLAFLVGDLQAGLAAMEKALAIAGSLDDDLEEGVTLSRLGPALGHAGRHDESRQLLQRAEALLSRTDDKEAYAGALSNLGHCHLLTGNYAGALPLLRRERELHKVQDARLRVANCETNMALALAGVGELDEAYSRLKAVASILHPETDGHQWVDFKLTSGRVALLAGEPEAALSVLQEGLQSSRSLGLHRIDIELLTELAKAQEASGDLAGALGSERALRDAERHWLDEQANTRLRTLESSLQLERERAARQALEQARSELEARVEARTVELQVQISERESAEEKARFWAHHDWLTRLPNRHQLEVSLMEGLEVACAGATRLGLLFIDLDGFKEVNDAHGHLFGDEVLRETARRLERHAPPGALVSRFGGDEFVVVLPELSTTEHALSVGQQLCGAVLEPLEIEGRQVRVSASIGVSIGPDEASTSEDLLRRANQALFEAKVAGRNRVLELDADAQHRLDRRSRIRRELEPSMDDGRLFSALQPLWDVAGGRLHSVELLTRWNDHHLGAVSPDEFIPVAEESELIARQGLWALRQACSAAKALRERAALPIADDLRVAVNLSTVQLSSPTLVDDFRRAVKDAGGDAAWLELELTESRQLAEDRAVRQRLHDLRALGFTLAVDDFGAGYSSFSYLSEDLFDRIKIDRGLLEAAIWMPNRAALIGSIVAMAGHLGLGVVGEGVETTEQLDLFISEGCTVIQGFHIARPMPLEALLEWSGPA